jgi:hypothetical protein
MYVNGTSCLLSNGTTGGAASDAGRKSSDSTGGQADSGLQIIRVPVCRRVARLIAVLAVTAAILGVVGHALGQCGMTEARTPVEELNSWLATSADTGQPCKDLPVKQLRAELAKGGQADWGTVAGILVACVNCEGQRDGSELAGVRRSLVDWLEQLPPPDAGSLAAACRSAKGAYRPNDEADLVRARSELMSAIERLDARLKAAGPSGDGWRAFLKWETMQEQLAGPSAPDLAVLNSLYPEYDSGYEGLRLIWFDDVRLALRQYLYTANAIGNSKLADRYAIWLDELAKRVESYGKTQSSDDAMVVGQAIQWLHDAGQAGWLVSVVRRKSLHPNLYAQASARFIRAAMSRDIDETQPVRDCILGTDIHATAHTVGEIGIELGDAEDRALIHVVMSGTAESDAVGYNGPVRIYNSGTTRINARKTIVVDAEHIRAFPATSNVTTSTTIHDIQSNKGRQFVEKIAWKRACRQKSQAEWIASRHAEERVNRRVDDESDELVGQAEEAYQSKFRTPLRERKLFPSDLRISSTAAYVSLASVQAGPFDLSAPSEPPALTGEPDVAIRVHESMVHNLASGALAGMLLEEERVLSAITDSLGSLPETLEPDKDSDPWGITFARRTPIGVSFADGQFKVTIRGRKYAKGQDEYPGMNISVAYKIEKTDAGFRAVRQGDLEIFPPGFVPGSGKRLSASQQVLRTMLQRRLGKMFEEVLIPEPIAFSGERSDRGTLVLTQWKAQDGWLVMGWQWKASEERLASSE